MRAFSSPRHSSWVRNITGTTILGLTLTLYQLSTSVSQPVYQGFTPLEWESGPNCVPLKDSPDGAITRLSVSQKLRGRTVCQSKPFQLPGSHVELTYRSTSSKLAEKAFKFELQSVRSDKKFAVKIPSPNQRHITRDWFAVHIDLPGQSAPQQFVLRGIADKSLRGGAVIELRDRVNLFSSSIFSFLRDRLTKTKARIIIAALCALSVGAFLFRIDPSISRFSLWALFTILAVAVHFRCTAYFMWDEWHILERFRDGGFASAFEGHNEHYIPLFFLTYGAEVFLFRYRYELYLLFSIALHALNAVLFISLLKRLVPEGESSKQAALLGGGCFLISGLNAEATQWAFQPCVLLMVTMALLGILSALRFLEAKQIGHAIGAALASFAAPLLFGNGFCVPALIGVTAIAQIVRTRENMTSAGRGGFFPLVVSSCAGMTIALGLYFLFGQTQSKTEVRSALAGAAEITRYVFVGGELGTVLRGVGLLPAYELTSAATLMPPALSRIISPEMALALVGVLISLLILALSLLGSKDKRAILVTWLLGQALILIPFLLPAIGRWKYGPSQALMLRYHCLPLIGVTILVSPLIASIVHRRAGSFLRTVLLISMFFFVSANLFGGAAFSYFTENGLRHRIFIAELQDWSRRLQATSPASPISYQGAGTKLSGLFPLFPETLTPGKTPDQIENLMHWLEPEAYPLR